MRDGLGTISKVQDPGLPIFLHATNIARRVAVLLPEDFFWLPANHAAPCGVMMAWG